MNDLISRQAAIEALAKHEKSRGHNYSLFMDVVSECAEVVRNLPPAQPDLSGYSDRLWKAAYERGKEEGRAERKKGKWLKRKDKEGRTYGACSACGAIQYAGITSFCHNCGADMRKMKVGE